VVADPRAQDAYREFVTHTEIAIEKPVTENLATLLLTQSQKRPELRIGTVDNQEFLGEALRLAAGGASTLALRGDHRLRRVAIVASSSTEYMLAWMACVLAGIPVALVNPTYPPELLTQMLANLDPDLVITDLADRSFAGPRPVVTLAETRQWPTADPAGVPGLTAAPSDLVSFMHTSGTTGVPKFCAQTHEYFLRLGGAVADALDLTLTDRMLAPLPLFHINPMGYGIIGALTAGADALTVSAFSARRFWPTVIEHEITALALHAPPVEILKRATTAERSVGHSVRTMFYADAEFMERFGIPTAVSGYGSTEAGGVSHLNKWALGQDIPIDASRFGGQARHDVEDRIGDSGEIFVRERAANTLFAGYFSNNRLDPARDEEGWFATGDLGRRDEDGGLVFLERAAESIRVKGEFVPIPFVEDKLGSISDLVDLALWKRRGELVDDEVVLYVVADPVPFASIQAAVADLPAFMRPAHVAQVVSIPRDAAAGKVQRRRLHEQEVLSWTTIS
jgi:crotonobetaine/carnitine-CoA ligase